MIDRRPVQHLSNDPDAAAIMRAVVGLSDALGISATAGVETLAQADRVRDERCRKVQGFLFGRPTPREAFAQFLKLEHVAV